jgi:hypothetical protein
VTVDKRRTHVDVAGRRVVVDSAAGDAPVDPEKRADKKLPHVIVKEATDKQFTSSYTVPQIPHEFSSAEAFEYSLKRPQGPEWTSLRTHNSFIRPKLMVRPGQIIDPLRWSHEVAVAGPKKKQHQGKLKAQRNQQNEARHTRNLREQQKEKLKRLRLARQKASSSSTVTSST